MKAVDFAGNTASDIRSQVRRQLVNDSDFSDDNFKISFFGDGGTGVFLYAMQSLAKPKSRKRVPLFVAPGGTMNLLSQHLNPDLKSNLCHYFSASDEERLVTRVNIRQLSLIRTRKGRPTKVENHPWVCFAGAGMDAYLLSIFESLPRNQSLPRKVATTARVIFTDVIRHGRELACYGVVALPRWGIIKFPDRYDSLHKEHFYKVSIGPNRGFGAVRDTFACNLAGLHPEVLNVLWQELPPPSTGVGLFDDMLSAAYTMCPDEVKEWSTPVPNIKGKAFFHVDGFPMQVNLLPDEKASLDFSTPVGEPVSVFRNK